MSSGGNNNQAISGALSGNGKLNLNIGASGTFSFRGTMSGFSGILALTGNGTLRYYGSAAGSSSAIFDTGSGSGTMRTRDGGTINLGSLSGGSGTTLNGATSSDLATIYNIGANNLSTTFAGLVTNGANIARSVAVSKVGLGVLDLAGAGAYTGPTTVSAGTLVLDGNFSNATNTVTVAPAATLAGAGIVGGNTVVNGTVAPGNAFSAQTTLSFVKNLTLNPGALCALEISKNPLVNDAISVSGVLQFGGTLSVVMVSPDILAEGDSFQVFSAPAHSGTFATVNLPDLDPSLTWDTTTLLNAGTLTVVKIGAPRFAQMLISGLSISFSGSGGTINATYYVLISTNLGLPVSQWSRIATNSFDASGNFSFSDPINPGSPRKFYLLQAPLP